MVFSYNFNQLYYSRSFPFISGWIFEPRAVRGT